MIGSRSVFASLSHCQLSSRTSRVSGSGTSVRPHSKAHQNDQQSDKQDVEDSDSFEDLGQPPSEDGM